MHYFLHGEQYGFRSGRSTSMAVMELVEKISTSVDEGDYAIGVLIDLSKAFDILDHSLLLNKIERYGVRGTALAWLKDISDRNQYVHMKNIHSERTLITHGVSQGSVLGPTLFIMYINDIVEVLQNCTLFADDTNLYCSGPDLEVLIDKVNSKY